MSTYTYQEAIIPLSANYPYDSNLSLLPTIQEYSNGFVSLTNPIHQGTKDISLNKNTLFFMSSCMNFLDFIEDKTLGSFANGMIAFKGANGKYIIDVDDVLYASGTELTSSALFYIAKNIDGTVTLIRGGKYVTVTRTAPWNLTLEDPIVGDLYNQQKFTFVLSNDKIAISTFFTNPLQYGPSVIKRYFSYSPVTENLRTIGAIVDDDYTTDNNYYFDIELYSGEYVVDGYKLNSSWVSYHSENEDKRNNKNVVVNEQTSIDNVKQNLLIDTEYKTEIVKHSLTDNITIGKYDINFAGLKNIHTPECEYTITPFISNDEAIFGTGPEFVKRRDYDKIFTGTNQEGGLENVFLGYAANTKQLTFEPDKVTYFHYPSAAPQIPLSAAGFIQSGAIAGRTPIRADKVWKKMANYQKNIWWGNSQSWQKGTYLCSWLSGIDDGKFDVLPVWKDRWYNPGYVDPTSAIFIPSDPSAVVVDMDSEMMLDQGVWYKYYHKGQDGNMIIVDSLTGDGTAIRLNLNNWAETTPDESPYENNGSLQPYSESMIQNNTLVLDGDNQECLVLYNSSFNLGGNVTIAGWTQAADWDNFNGNSFIDNNFRGGWSIGYTNGFFNPILPVYDSTYGHILFTNIEKRIYLDKVLPLTGNVFAEPVAIDVAPDLFTWVLDNGYKRLYRTEYNGDILDQVIFDDNEELKDIVIDNSDNVWVLGSDYISSFNAFNASYNSRQALTANRINVDLNGTVFGTSGIDLLFDNDNYRWEIIDSNTLTLSDSAVLTASNIASIGCDSSSNIWVLTNNTDFIKLDSSGTYLLSGAVSTNDTNSARYVSFTNEYVNGEYVDYVWVVQAADGKLYKYNTNGALDSTISLTNGIDITQYYNHQKALMNFNVNGDFTGYDWHRKFEYVPNNQEPHIKFDVTLGGDLIPSATLTVKHPTSALVDNDWHHFAVTYNSTSGSCKFYVDSVLTDEVSAIPNSQIYYEYKNPLLIGANMGRFNSLDTELSINKYHANIKFDDLRIYDWVVSNSDIYHIYSTKQTFEDMIWNIPIGTQNYIEEIERFFKHKLPGSKSQYYNIRLVNLGITDPTTRNIIEEIIKDTVTKISPAYTELYRIIWE